MIVSLLLAVQVAFADIPSDLAVAADQNLPEESRRAAFDRVVREGAADPSPLIIASQTGEDTRQRWVAIRALGYIGNPQGRTTLVTLLEDPEPAIRTAAVSALAEVGDPAYSQRAAAMLADPAVIVRAAAAGALAEMRDPKTVSALVAALESSDSFYRGSSLWVRQHYVAALGAIGDLSALPALLRALDDDDPSVSAVAVTALEQLSGFSFADGRDEQEERAAWRRWATTQIQSRGLR